jgi:methionyl aminopeptidase
MSERQGSDMVELKTRGEIEAMREAGRVVAQALAAARENAAVGVTLKELDEIAHSVIRDAGATSPFLNYRPHFAMTPFPAVICASVNDAALHGIPDAYQLRDGDLLSIDCGATLDGWTGDSAISFSVGQSRPADERLIAVTSAALDAGIAAARPDGKLGDISAAVASVGRAAGVGISREFGGHGVGRQMHEDPHVPNEGRAGRGLRLRAGLVLAIEPWFLAGGKDDYVIDDDGWTIRSADGSRAAHVEHTIAITDDGPLILTQL